MELRHREMQAEPQSSEVGYIASGRQSAGASKATQSEHCSEATELAALIEKAEREVDRHRRLVLAPAAVAAVLLSTVGSVPHSPIGLYAVLAIVPLIVFLGVSHAVKFHQTTKALAASNDVRMIGPLIDRLRGGRRARRVRRTVTSALAKLLPQLTPQDFDLLSSNRKASLTHYLGQLSLFQYNKPLQLAILRALLVVGEGNSIPVVEAIARRRPRWDKQVEIQRAALECLPVLRKRAEAETAKESLLRASEAGASTCDDLLLPAAGASSHDPAELLRADSPP